MGQWQKNGLILVVTDYEIIHQVLSRAQVLFSALASGFDQLHLGSNLEGLEDAIRYGETVGDR
jgi:hypothetical protein